MNCVDHAASCRISVVWTHLWHGSRTILTVRQLRMDSGRVFHAMALYFGVRAPWQQGGGGAETCGGVANALLEGA